MLSKIKAALSPSTDQVDSAVDLVFGPLQVLLCMVGLLGPRPDSHVVVRTLLWLHWALTGTFMFGGVIFIVILIYPDDRSAKAILDFVWDIVCNAVYLVIYVHWKVTLEKKLDSILQELRHLEKNIGSLCFWRPRAVRWKLLLFLIGTLFLQLVVSIVIAHPSAHSDFTSRNHFFSSEVTQASFGFTQVFYFLYLIFLPGLEGACLSLYVLLCSSTSRMFQALNQKLSTRIADSTDMMEEEEMEEFRGCHQRLRHLTKNLDNLFVVLIGTLLLLSLAYYFISIYYFIFESLSSSKLSELIGLTVYGVFYTAIILVQAIRIKEQAYSIKETLNRIPSSRMSDRTLALVSLFSSELTSDPAGLTFGKTFLLDKMFYATLFGALLSYTIVLIQAKSSAPLLASCTLNVTNNATVD